MVTSTSRPALAEVDHVLLAPAAVVAARRLAAAEEAPEELGDEPHGVS
jgi:hypothetical protein